MESKYGFPIVTADNLFEVLNSLGIRNWPHFQPPMDIEDYLAGNLTDRQLEEARRFAPKSEVVFLQDPRGKPFRGFRSVIRNSMTAFTLFPDDLLVITAEFKHGAEVVVLVPPSGVPTRTEADLEDPMSACAKREFWEETGVKLKEAISLSGPEGIPSITRYSTHRFFPFLGIPKMPISPRKQRHDSTEFLKVVLIPLQEWLKLIECGKVLDAHSISITLLALRRLERLKVE